MLSRICVATSLLVGVGCNSNNGGGPDATSPDAHKHDAPVLDAPLDAPPENLGSDFPLESIGAIAYAASITIGDGQTFELDVDTGSTTLGVAGSTCSSCMVTPEWTPDATAVDQGVQTMAEYGDQSTWSGETFADNVKIMGDTDVTMIFGDISTESGFLIDGTVQGIIGFLGPEAAFANTDSFMTKRSLAGLPTEFSFQFCPDVGHLWFGGFNPDSVLSPPQFTPLAAISNDQPFFALQVNSTTIAGQSIGLSGGIIADTGTSLMVVSGAVESNTIAAVQGSTGFQQIFSGQTLSEDSCLDPGSSSRADIDAALPTMQVEMPKVGGGTFTVTATATQSYLFFQQGQGYCFGMEEVADVPETIFGIAFLRQFVDVFDGPNSQIGFAPESGCVLPDVDLGPLPVSRQPPHWYLRGRLQ